jgi:hypothetical protein
MLRTARSPLEGLWSLAYRLTARSVAAYLRRRHPRSTAYVRGSLAGGDPLFGVSDIDLVLVTASWPGRPGEARASMLRRFDRLCAIAPPLRVLVHVAVYEEADLRQAVAGSPCLCPAPIPEGSGEPQPFARVDPAELAVRPGLAGPTRDWRRIAGRDRLPAVGVLASHQLRIAAWMEVQYWWRYAIEASAAPAGPRRLQLCFKLVSEPTRVLLRLAHGERFEDRRAALRRALELYPEESEALRFALDVDAALPRSPSPRFADALRHLVGLTSRIAGELAQELDPAGATEVRLVWGGEDELATGARARDPLRALLDREPALLPLVDWRALARPDPPDETLASTPGSPADPSTLRAAALAGRSGPYPALSADRLLVLATTAIPGRARLRAVQCPVTDPVSFALLEGRGTAGFPDAEGWSIRETAARAVTNHRAALPAAAADRGVGELATLFTAARAGLLMEGVEERSPELPLTVAAVAAQLDARSPKGGVARAAYEAYREARSSGIEAPARTVTALRNRVLSLPAYRR